jgi:hypothetical protein
MAISFRFRIKKRTALFTLLAALLLTAVCTSCGRKAAGASGGAAASIASGDIIVRDEGFRMVQSTLVSDDAAAAAKVLLKSVERRRTEVNGLIRESIDLSKGSIRYYSADPAAVLPAPVAAEGNAGTLEIVDWGPEGELPAENRRPDIYLMFSQPMVPLARLGEPMTESPLMSVDPPVSGIYRWYGSRMLSFRPDTALGEAPRYRISVSAGAASILGGKLDRDFEFSVYGESLKMVNVYPGNDAETAVDTWDIPTGTARYFILEFNQPVDPQSVAVSVSVEVNGRRHSFQAGRPEYPEALKSRTERALLLTLDEEPSEDAEVSVTLEKGAVPREGYPASGAGQTWRFRTIRPFGVEEFSAYPGDFPRDNRPALYPVYLRFTHPLDESAELPKFNITVNGAARTPGDTGVYWSTAAFHLPDIKPGDEVRIQVPPGVKDLNGRVCGPGVYSVEIPRPYPMVDFPYQYDGLRHLEAEFRPAMVWATRNIVEGSFGSMGTPNFYDQRELAPDTRPVDFASMPRNLTVVHEEDLAPLLGPDGYGTARFSYVMRQDPQQVDPRWQWNTGSVAVQVTNLGLSVRSSHNRVLVWVNRLSDGTPVGGAEVTAFNLEDRRYRQPTRTAWRR